MATNLITAQQAAKYLGISTRTLANWRCFGYPNIPFCKIGRCIRYRIEDLDAYIAKNTRLHESLDS